MAKNLKVLTTGQVAKVCNVAPRTVTKWFDDGRIGGYRIPGSRDRRIPLAELKKFMAANDIPISLLEEWLKEKMYGQGLSEAFGVKKEEEVTV